MCPSDIGHLLDATNRGLQAIPQDNLQHGDRRGLHRASVASVPSCRRIVDGIDRAGRSTRAQTVDPLTTLIDQSPAGAELPSATSRLDRSVGSEPRGDHRPVARPGPAFADLLDARGPAPREGAPAVRPAAPTLPVLLANLVSLGTVAVTYQPRHRTIAGAAAPRIALMRRSACRTATPNRTTRGSICLQPQPQPAAAVHHRLPAAHQQRSPASVDYPTAPPATCTAGCPKIRRSTSAVRATFPCETRPGKTAPDSRDVRKRREATFRSTTATTGKATPTPLTRPRRAAVSPRAVTRRAATPQGTAQPPPPVAVATYDQATGDYSARTGAATPRTTWRIRKPKTGSLFSYRHPEPRM